MANEEQLALLKQGVEVWNVWRKINLLVEINLQNANLSGIDLSNADLSSANLQKATLHKTDLREADLTGAKLRKANLSSAFLYAAKLYNADLRFANLHNVDLSNALLVYTDLYQANLSGATLRDANLHFARLILTDLQEANLCCAQLDHADLSGAKLCNANLHSANLNATRVLGANFKCATLTGACIAHCSIGDSTILDNVECDYIFRGVKPGGEFIERRPHAPDSIFKSGEFTKLVRIHENTVELIFRKGINWSAFAHAFNETNTKVFDASGQELYLKKYEVLDDGLIRLEVTVPPGSDKQFIHGDLEGCYEKIVRLEGMVQAKNEMLEQVLRMLKPGDIYMNSSKYDQRGAQFAGGFAETVNGNQIGGIINNYGQNTDDILRLLTSLRDLSQTFPDEQKVEAEIELDALAADLNKPEKLEPKRLSKHLKRLIVTGTAAGTAAATLAGGAVTFSDNINQFTDNVFELGEKIGLSREEIQN